LASFLKDVDDLERATTSLPHVEEDGSSECPFSGELYAKKEELEEKVTSGVNRLHDCLADLAKEIQRCKANLGRIQADSAKLNLQETQDCYSEAESEQQRQYRHVVQDREAILVALGKAEAVLKISRTRKSPGGTPRRQTPPSSAPSGPGGLGKELDGLLSLGPLSDPDNRDN
jgi:DNA repair exonuclease SbcCD ATPase subunit